MSSDAFSRTPEQVRLVCIPSKMLNSVRLRQIDEEEIWLVLPEELKAELHPVLGRETSVPCPPALLGNRLNLVQKFWR